MTGRSFIEHKQTFTVQLDHVPGMPDMDFEVEGTLADAVDLGREETRLGGLWRVLDENGHVLDGTW